MQRYDQSAQLGRAKNYVRLAYFIIRDSWIDKIRTVGSVQTMQTNATVWKGLYSVSSYTLTRGQ